MDPSSASDILKAILEVQHLCCCLVVGGPLLVGQPQAGSLMDQSELMFGQLRLTACSIESHQCGIEGGFYVFGVKGHLGSSTTGRRTAMSLRMSAMLAPGRIAA